MVVLDGNFALGCGPGTDCPFHSFIHSFGMCRIRRFLAVLRSFFHSPLLCNFSCHPSPPTIRPFSLTSSCHLFLGLPLNLVFRKFMYNIFFVKLITPKYKYLNIC